MLVRGAIAAAHLLAATLLLPNGGPSAVLLARAQEASCSMADLMDLPDVVAVSCEHMPGDSCAGGFPPTCSITCAQTLIGYWDLCRTMVQGIPASTFPDVPVAALPDFVETCRFKLEVLESSGQGGCTDQSLPGGQLPSMVEQVDQACCNQNGANVCVDTSLPQTCDIECAQVFLPYRQQCLSQQPELFGELHQACTEHLPAEDVRALMSQVALRAAEPQCTIDTSQIRTLRDVKVGQLPCAMNESPLCEVVISAGVKSCEVDFCEQCVDSHQCDAECQFPCQTASNVTQGSGFPGASGGHRLLHRLLSEIGVGLAAAMPVVNRLTMACPIDSFETALQAVVDACCAQGVDCETRMPEDCPYDCGIVFSDFMRDCSEVLILFVDGSAMDIYTSFSAQCLLLDPETIIMALHNSECAVCGDGVVGLGEHCDAGEANSDDPDGQCRTDCKPQRCGDGIVDSDEVCDHGDGQRATTSDNHAERASVRFGDCDRRQLLQCLRARD